MVSRVEAVVILCSVCAFAYFSESWRQPARLFWTIAISIRKASTTGRYSSTSSCHSFLPRSCRLVCFYCHSCISFPVIVPPKLQPPSWISKSHWLDKAISKLPWALEAKYLKLASTSPDFDTGHIHLSHTQISWHLRTVTQPAHTTEGTPFVLNTFFCTRPCYPACGQVFLLLSSIVPVTYLCLSC